MIERYEFTGRVIPDHEPFQLLINEQLTFDEKTREEFGFIGRMQVRITGPRIKVELEIHEGSVPEELGILINIVQYQVRAILDVACFLEPAPYDIQLETIKLGDWEEKIPLRRKHDFAIMSKHFEVKTIIQHAFQIPELRRALNSLRMSLRYQSDLALFSFQAIEAVRHYFEDRYGLSQKQAWEKMRVALNLQGQEWFEEIGKYSKEQRHGGSEDISGVLQTKFTRQAWQVTLRFVELLHRNVEQLPEEEFPILE
jgi:hypothetical protein